MADVKKISKTLDGTKMVGYKTPTGRKTHWGAGGKAKARALSKRGQKAAQTRRLRALIGG